MTAHLFTSFFQGKALEFLHMALDAALDEDGPDLTSQALFSPGDMLAAELVAKEECVLAGLPLMEITCRRLDPAAPWSVTLNAEDGERAAKGQVVARVSGPAALLLRAERVMLNFITHMSGIATLTAQYVEALQGSRTRLLDTRKTLPGLRHVEKYSVRMGGGSNHRLDLAELLMLKDNHIDRAGSITVAVQALRDAYDPCPPIEVECRTTDDVREAVSCAVTRIMLDNMDLAAMEQALALIPKSIESEVSGNVNLATIRDIARLGPDFVSVGRIIHSAPAADLSLRVSIKESQ